MELEFWPTTAWRRLTMFGEARYVRNAFPIEYASPMTYNTGAMWACEICGQEVTARMTEHHRHQC